MNLNNGTIGLGDIRKGGRRMLKQLQLIMILVLSCAIPALAYVTDDEWVLSKKSDADILIYTKVIEGQPIKAVKAVTTFEVSIETLLTVLTDTDLVPEWVPLIGEAVLLQETDPDGISIMYIVTSFPWPVKDRDVVVQTSTEYEESSRTVVMESGGLSGYMDEKPGLIRTPANYARWRISTLESGNVQVEFIAHSDPGGHIPAWFANMLVTRTPKIMFSRLRTALEKEEASNRPFDELFVFGKPVDL